MRAFALNCTLKYSPAPSSTDVILDEIEEELVRQGVPMGRRRVVDHHIRRGVSDDEGSGDEWPALRAEILAADIFVLATPIWMGHPGSVAQQVVERLDAFLRETDERQQMITAGKVAVVAVVGNEDGAHHVGAELFQAMNDVGFTIPANGMTYWVGEAMGSIDYRDLDHRPIKTAVTTKTMVTNAVWLASVLANAPYPTLHLPQDPSLR